jgi:hypothetical protein
MVLAVLQLELLPPAVEDNLLSAAAVVDHLLHRRTNEEPWIESSK